MPHLFEMLKQRNAERFNNQPAAQTDTVTHGPVTYTVTFKIALADYSSVVLTETFTVTIGVCDITGINLDTTLADTTKTYNVAPGQANYAYTPFTFAPAVCTNYGITYTAKWNDATVLKNLPSFIVYNQASSRFEVNTSTETDDGTYKVRLTGDMDDPETESTFKMLDFSGNGLINATEIRQVTVD